MDSNIGCSWSCPFERNIFLQEVNYVTRLIDKLPKVVLGSEESLALSHGQQLLVIMYYSGPQFVVDHILQSPNSVFAGCLDKLLKSRSSSVGYLDSVSELKAGTNITSDCLTIMAAVPQNSKIKGIQEKDIRNGQHLSLITEIPLGCLRKLVYEIRMKDYNKASWHSWYNRTGSGQLLHQASTAVCVLNEMIFGISDQATDFFTRIFPNSRKRRKEVRESGAGFADGQPFEIESTMFCEFSWKVLQDEGLRSHLIDCIGRILHEFLSHEVWELPTEHKSLGIHYILTMKLKILV
ncbi:hypothetical protein Pyn_20950 [Prunus yedoensis var. nudiflora]|uniref:Uncharacterized protein n=1 Tax=Prunus yedoensis var. nudiflora TaxID=2094558 RepID=A0A314UFH2_PRUYE|nr:hypothetical protein Pyn_20950 [Prunus yedoensis var. nudiflora]